MLISLGVCDALFDNWNEAQFKKDYKAFLETFQGFSKAPKIYPFIPPPSVNNAYPGFQGFNQTVVNDLMPTLIPQIAAEVGISAENVFNLNTILGTKDDLEP